MMRHPFLTPVTVGFDAFLQSRLTAYQISGYYILAMNKIRRRQAWYGVAAVLVMA